MEHYFFNSMNTYSSGSLPRHHYLHILPPSAVKRKLMMGRAAEKNTSLMHSIQEGYLFVINFPPVPTGVLKPIPDTDLFEIVYRGSQSESSWIFQLQTLPYVKKEVSNIVRPKKVIYINENDILTHRNLPKSPLSESKPIKPMIKSIDVSCQHGRQASDAGLLEIVADTSTHQQETYTVMGITSQLDKRTHGHDTLTAKFALNYIGTYGVSPSIRYIPLGGKSVWSGGLDRVEYPVDAPTLTTKTPWLAKAEPQQNQVQVRDVDDKIHAVTIKNYPSTQYSMTLSATAWEKWADKLNNTSLDWFRDAFAVDITPKITPPKGDVNLQWGWQEEKDNWRAYHQVKAAASLEPLIGIEFDIQVSMARLVSARVGIPPVVSDLISKHLADVLVYSKVEVTLSLLGDLTHKLYSDESDEQQGSVKSVFKGTLGLGLKSEWGSRYIVKASAKVEGRTTLNSEGKLSVDREGVTLEEQVRLNPLTVNVFIKLSALVGLAERVREGQWTLFNEIKLYDDKITLLSRDTS